MEKRYFYLIIYILVITIFFYLLINEKKISLKINLKVRRIISFLLGRINIKIKALSVNVFLMLNFLITTFYLIGLVCILEYFFIGNFLVPTASMKDAIKPKDRLLGNMYIYKFIKPKRGDIIVFKEPLQNKFLYAKRLVGMPGEKVRIDKYGNLLINGKILENEKLHREYKQMELSSLLSRKEWYIPKKGDYVELKASKIDFEIGEEILDIVKLQTYMKENNVLLKKIMPKSILWVNGKDLTGPILDLAYNEKDLKTLLDGGKVYLKQDYYFVLGDNTKASLDSRYWGLLKENRIKSKIFFRFWPLQRVGKVK